MLEVHKHFAASMHVGFQQRQLCIVTGALVRRHRARRNANAWPAAYDVIPSTRACADWQKRTR